MSAGRPERVSIVDLRISARHMRRVALGAVEPIPDRLRDQLLAQSRELDNLVNRYRDIHRIHVGDPS